MQRCYFIVFVLFVIFSCKNDDDVCVNEYVNFTSIENTSDCENIMWEYTLNTNDDYLIIRSHEEFSQLVNTSDCDAQINFDEYSLIIGSTYVSSGTTFDYEVIYNCSENNIYML